MLITSRRIVYGYFFFQAEDGIRDLVRSRGLGDVYKRQTWSNGASGSSINNIAAGLYMLTLNNQQTGCTQVFLSLIHI